MKLKWHPIYQSIRNLTISKENLVGTVKPYKHHIAVLTTEDRWHKAFVRSGTIQSKLFNIVNRNQDLKENVKLNNFYHPEIKNGLIIFPQGVIIDDFKEEELESILLNLIDFNELEFKKSFPKLSLTKLKTKKQLIICTHAEVDCRCGTIGNQLYSKAIAELKDKYDIFKTSHIGGHKYAGNIIVYPEGDWYGHVNLNNFEKFIDNLDNDSKLWDLWRGNHKLDLEEQKSIIKNKV